MVFSVTYKACDGSSKEELVEAPNRSKCLELLNQKGIFPICLREGAKSTHFSTKENLPHRRFVLFLWAISLTLGLFVVALYCTNSNTGGYHTSSQTTAKPHQTKVHAPADKHLNAEEPKLKPHIGNQWRPSTTPAKTANVPLPVIDSQDVINLRELNRKFFGTPIFKHTSENTIAGILSTIPGERFVLDELDPGFDRDFKESLTNKIEIFSDDPDDVKAQKQAVLIAKEQLSKVLANGESPGSVLSGIMRDLNEIADYRDSLEENVRLLCNFGSEQDIREYLAEANTILSEYNAMKIEISNKRWQRILRRLENEPPQTNEGSIQ